MEEIVTANTTVDIEGNGNVEMNQANFHSLDGNYETYTDEVENRPRHISHTLNYPLWTFDNNLIGGSELESEHNVYPPSGIMNSEISQPPFIVTSENVFPIPCDVSPSTQGDKLVTESKRKKYYECCTCPRKAMSRWPIFGLLLIFLVASAVIVVLVIHHNKKTFDLSSKGDSQLDGNILDDASFDLRDYFRELSDPSTFLVPDSPQSRAFTWFTTCSQDPSLWQSTQDVTHRLVQRYAIAVIAFSCTYNLWLDTSFQKRHAMENECNWSISKCNDNGYLTELALDHLGLAGSIPDEIGLLSNLKILSASGNRLQGRLLPISAYGKLTSLERLSLSFNEVSSSIPSEIGLLSNSLIAFEASHNVIAGSVPQSFKALSKLELLDLSSNMDLQCDVFSFLPYLKSLRELYIGSTNFTGFNFENILYQGLSQNYVGLDLRGLSQVYSIPTTIGLFTSLKRLQLGSKTDRGLALDIMYGTIPSEIGRLTKLQLFHIEETKISGTIPTEFGILTSLSDLFIINNQIAKGIPSEFGLMKALQIVVLTGNQLSGIVPTEFGRLEDLAILAIDDNENVTIPEEWCRDSTAPTFTISSGNTCNCC
jgi:Leucine-rich repeat (LRR) protein